MRNPLTGSTIGRRDPEDRRPPHARTAAQRATKMSLESLAEWISSTAHGIVHQAELCAGGGTEFPQARDAEVLVELVREMEARATHKA